MYRGKGGTRGGLSMLTWAIAPLSEHAGLLSEGEEFFSRRSFSSNSTLLTTF